MKKWYCLAPFREILFMMIAVGGACFSCAFHRFDPQFSGISRIFRPRIGLKLV